MKSRQERRSHPEDLDRISTSPLLSSVLVAGFTSWDGLRSTGRSDEPGGGDYRSTPSAQREAPF